MSVSDYEKFKYGATAHVTATVEVVVNGSWGGECSVAQIHKQAAEEAANKIRNLFKEGVRLRGDPQVTAVMAVRKSD